MNERKPSLLVPTSLYLFSLFFLGLAGIGVFEHFTIDEEKDARSDALANASDLLFKEHPTKQETLTAIDQALEIIGDEGQIDNLLREQQKRTAADTSDSLNELDELGLNFIAGELDNKAKSLDQDTLPPVITGTVGAVGAMFAVVGTAAVIDRQKKRNIACPRT